MKEAAGEANLTVIAIILIGVVAAVVTPLVNSYLKSAAKKSCCTNAGGIWKNNACQEVNSASGSYTAMVESTYWNANERVCVDK
ncbi:MAG: hypothetical protein SOZ95_05500 [Bacilli bacterium]|nr:hypothetical protein [Bacilli bacterium]